MKPLTADYLQSLFSDLETGNSEEFFRNVAEDVNWTVMGTHPLAGTYTDKTTFIRSTFQRLGRVLRDGVRLRVTNVIVAGEIGVVELEALSTALNGTPFNNRYCWICRFRHEQIVEVRAYLDSALVAKIIKENEPAANQENS